MAVPNALPKAHPKAKVKAMAKAKATQPHAGAQPQAEGMAILPEPDSPSTNSHGSSSSSHRPGPQAQAMAGLPVPGSPVSLVMGSNSPPASDDSSSFYRRQSP